MCGPLTPGLEPRKGPVPHFSGLGSEEVEGGVGGRRRAEGDGGLAPEEECPPRRRAARSVGLGGPKGRRGGAGRRHGARRPARPSLVGGPLGNTYAPHPRTGRASPRTGLSAGRSERPLQ